MVKPKLGYWKIRGLAQPIRLLLTYVGQDFEDVQYEQGDAPDFSREKWMSVKPDFAKILDFPNLPYYIDGDIKITQSNAILRHIARQHKLEGETDAEKAVVDMLLDVAMDLRNAVVRLCYNKEFENLKEDHFKNVQPAFALLEKKLGDNDWFVGNKITVPDFHFYEMFAQHLLMKPGCFDSHPKLTAFVKRFENLPEIKAYLARPEVKNMPVNNKTAAFK